MGKEREENADSYKMREKMLERIGKNRISMKKK